MAVLIFKLLLVIWATGTVAVFCASLATWFVYRDPSRESNEANWAARWALRCWAWPLAIPPLLRDFVRDSTKYDHATKEDQR